MGLGTTYLDTSRLGVLTGGYLAYTYYRRLRSRDLVDT